MAEQEKVPPLEEDIRALLLEAKPIAALDAATQAALLARITARLPLPSSDGGGSDGGNGALPHGGGAAAPMSKGAASIALALAVGLAGGIAIDRSILGATTVSP